MLLGRVSFLLSLPALALAGAAWPADAASLTGLPFTDAWDVSADGTTVAGGSVDPVVWTAEGGPVVLPKPAGSPLGSARALSADGSVAVGFVGFEDSAVRWSGTSFELLESGSSQATAVSADGSVVVGRSRSVPVRWDGASGATPLPGGAYGVASAVTPDASRVVGQADGRAVEWSGGTMTLLPDLGGGSTASAISADGRTIVGRVTLPAPPSAQHLAARWIDGQLSTLELLDDTRVAVANDVSALGDVTVGYAGDTFYSGLHAVLWDERGVHDIAQLLADAGVDVGGWTLETATAISADGLVVVGNGSDPDGLSRGWVAVVPEPATGTLTALGLAVVAAVRWRHPRTRSPESMTSPSPSPISTRVDSSPSRSVSVSG